MLLSSWLLLGLTIPAVFAREHDGHPMFVVSADKGYIIDKVEGNAYEINDHSLYSVVWCVTFCFMYPRLKTRDRDVAKKTAILSVLPVCISPMFLCSLWEILWC
jgi:hypothetical protein